MKNEKKKADEAKPKKPQTAYQYYTLEFKANFKQQNPKSTVKMAEVTAQCAQSWAVLTDKVKYESKALEEKKKYDEKLVEYKASIQKLKEKDPPTQVIESDDSLSEEYQKKLNQSEKVKPRLKKVYERKEQTMVVNQPNFQGNEMLDAVYKRSR